MKKICAVLVANRSEIAIRVFRAASELGMRTIAIYSQEDRLALHRFKADEAYLVGRGKSPVAAYLDAEDILDIASKTGADAIHPGYGFLSEKPEFAESCEKAGFLFIGPTAKVMRDLGNKVAARALAKKVGVPMLPASDALPDNLDQVLSIAEGIGYPLMVKASWGGGGRGMREIDSRDDLPALWAAAGREARAAFGNGEVYFEKLVRRAHHVEVQLLGDTHNNLVHLFDRDCSIQRRHQKVVEQAPAPYLSADQRQSLCEAALKIGRAVNYSHAGTVEFLHDVDSGEFYFIEVNPRIQVEHTVTEMITGVDLVKAQLRISEGGAIGEDEYLPSQQNITFNGHAIQCRVTTEDPRNGFAPDYGRITGYRSGAGFGLRLDGGTAYAGAVITPYYDSLLVKVTAWGRTSKEAGRRMWRGLKEFRVRGLSSNLEFLENVILHADFQAGKCTTRFLDHTPELLNIATHLDPTERLLRYLGEITVNGHPEMKGRTQPALPLPQAMLPPCNLYQAPIPGTRQRLQEMGAEGFARWMRAEKRVLFTDTTMRDAHQSLFATRLRTYDILAIAPYYARMVPQLLSLECWGGATFDVCLRFLKEDPWARIRKLREAVPNILLQMLLRGSNAVGYTNYSDNVVRHFVAQAVKEGVDLFRVFDAFNNPAHMQVAMQAVRENGALCEAALCYSGDLFSEQRCKFNLDYYLRLAEALVRQGAHILAIKDMAGVCRPRAAAALVAALRERFDLPIHFHTHDTSGISAASVLAAIAAGADAVDGAMDSMSGLTSQPNLSAIAASLSGSERDSGLDLSALGQLSDYWQGARKFYSPFESDLRSGSAEVYRHEMPGGQYTNLREQARSMGLSGRWREIAEAYADINLLWGDIVKVTPSSKVVGDMALFMASQGLTIEQVADPKHAVAFPQSVVSMFKGELGWPPEGFPSEVIDKVLSGGKPDPRRPGDYLPPADMEEGRRKLQMLGADETDDAQVSSWQMYPQVYADFVTHQQAYGEVSVLPTPNFYYGMSNSEEITVNLGRGRDLVILQQSVSATDEKGRVKVYYDVNGQPRSVTVFLPGQKGVAERPKAISGNADQVGAHMPGAVGMVAVAAGQQVEKGDSLLSLEAMKMETLLRAERSGIIGRVLVRPGDTVEARDLLIEYAKVEK